jgi:hypothetical protein
MASYYDWVSTKLSGAPSTACVFWVDVDQLLAQRHGGTLSDADPQSVFDDFGHKWTLVSYRANPFPARRKLAEAGARTIVWCIGDPTLGTVNLTPFEDYLGRAWSIVDVSLDAIAQELRPELSVPKGLSAMLRGISLDATAYIDALAKQSINAPLSKRSALDVLLRLTLRRDHAIDVTNASHLLASSAVSLASATTTGAISLIKRVLSNDAEIDATYGALMRKILQTEPRDVIGAVYLGSAFARLGIANIGALLTAEGFCPPGLRAAFEIDGQWQQLTPLLNDDDIDVLDRYVEGGVADSAYFARVRSVLATSPFGMKVASSEPAGLIRLAAILSRFEEFLDSGVSASAIPTSRGRHGGSLNSADAVAKAVGRGAEVQSAPPPNANQLEQLATAYVASPLAGAALDVAEGWLAVRRLEDRLAPDTAPAVRSLLRRADQAVRDTESAWDECWASIIRRDVNAYLGHERQSWRRSKYFAEGADSASWLVVLDGLRYDLWKYILVPALEQSGWRVPAIDVSFSFLPSLTEISRRTLVGGSPAASRGSESKLTEAIAAERNVGYTYTLRSEHFEDQRDTAERWNVRVFSWPDKFVHSDLADLGTLADQFGKWVESQFIPWLRVNVPRNGRLAVGTDHGFVALDPNEAILVSAADPGDRNAPRVLNGAHPEVGDEGIVVPDGDSPSTVATSRRWFKSPGGRHWQFAHGGCTIHETIVPFAVLEPVREGAPEITISGLPKEIAIQEGERATLEFSVRVSGGTDMFPTVVANTNIGTLIKETVPLGTLREFRFELLGAEGLESVIVRVTSGNDQRQEAVKVDVALSKIKRRTLDLDL